MSAQPSQFDSHRFVKRLTDAGVSEEVAEILADEHASRIIPADVATRSDVADARAGTKADIDEVKAATKASIDEVKAATKASIDEAKAGTKADIDAAEERIRSATTAEISATVAAAEERIRTSVREDILAAEARIRAELATAMAGFKDVVADYKTSTLKWMFGMMMAFTGLVITSVVTLVVSLG